MKFGGLSLVSVQRGETTLRDGNAMLLSYSVSRAISRPRHRESSRQPPRHHRGMLTFYFSPGSSSMTVHIALDETGAPFEARPLSLAEKDTQKPEFLAINPNGKVPTC
jgi:hypothetical protein